MQDMNGASHLWRRGARYYFRQRVPQDLVAVLGKREIKSALGTTDPKVARQLLPEKAAAVARIFAEARGKPTQAAPSDGPDAAAVEALRVSVYREKLRQLQAELAADPLAAHRMVPDEPDPRTGEACLVSALDASLEHEVDALRDALRFGDWGKPLREKVDEILENQVIRLRHPEDHDALRRVVAKALFDAMTQFRNGAAASVPAHGTPSASGSAFSFTEIFEKWLDERQPPPKTRLEFERAASWFSKEVGTVPIQAITREHVRRFKEALRRRQGRGGMPLAAGSVNKALGAVSTVLGWAIRNGYLEGNNPASGMKVVDPESAKDKRLPFDDDDLRAIFASPVFSGGERPVAGGGAAAYWLPLLGLYTGARLEELCQLLVTDVRTQGAIVYLDLNAVEESKRLKTKGSRRKVPLHPALLRLGFVEYVEGVRRGGNQRVFPGLRQDSRGAWSVNFSKWWGRYLRHSLGIADRRKVFHSFRHAFKDGCRRARVPEEIQRVLMGHAGEGVASTYGGGWPLELLAEEVEKIAFQGASGLVRASSPRRT